MDDTEHLDILGISCLEKPIASLFALFFAGLHFAESQ